MKDTSDSSWPDASDFCSMCAIFGIPLLLNMLVVGTVIECTGHVPSSTQLNFWFWKWDLPFEVLRTWDFLLFPSSLLLLLASLYVSNSYDEWLEKRKKNQKTHFGLLLTILPLATVLAFYLSIVFGLVYFIPTFFALVGVIYVGVVILGYSVRIARLLRKRFQNRKPHIAASDV